MYHMNNPPYPINTTSAAMWCATTILAGTIVPTLGTATPSTVISGPVIPPLPGRHPRAGSPQSAQRAPDQLRGPTREKQSSDRAPPANPAFESQLAPEGTRLSNA